MESRPQRNFAPLCISVALFRFPQKPKVSVGLDETSYCPGFKQRVMALGFLDAGYYVSRKRAAKGGMAERTLAALDETQSMKDKQTDKARSEQERLLDQALEETFPASDPISMQQMIIVGRIERPLLDGVARGKTEKKP
jgi:hypothetical protein